MEFFSSEAVCGKYDSDVLKSNEGYGKELEEQLIHFYSLLVVEQQSPKINRLVYIVFEGDTKQNEVFISEDKGINVLFYASSFATFQEMKCDTFHGA